MQVGPGTLYALLAKFQEGDMIEETRQEGRKKWYRITEKGNDSLKKEYRRILAMARDGAAGLEGDRDDGKTLGFWTFRQWSASLKKWQRGDGC